MLRVGWHDWYLRKPGWGVRRLVVMSLGWAGWGVSLYVIDVRWGWMVGWGFLLALALVGVSIYWYGIYHQLETVLIDGVEVTVRDLIMPFDRMRSRRMVIGMMHGGVDSVVYLKDPGGRSESLYLDVVSEIYEKRWEKSKKVKVLFLGGGGGGLPLVMVSRFANLSGVIVEKEKGMVELMRKYFEPLFETKLKPRMETVVTDAGAFVVKEKHKFNLIFQDIFRSENQALDQFVMTKWVNELHKKLVDDGVLIINLGGGTEVMGTMGNLLRKVDEKMCVYLLKAGNNWFWVSSHQNIIWEYAWRNKFWVKEIKP